MSLKGSAQGATRANIIRHAKDAAAKYYDTDCIGVELSNEATETVTDRRVNGGLESIATGYMADWKADIKHSWWEAAYGRTECRHCKVRPA